MLQAHKGDSEGKSSSLATKLERFQAKWAPVRVKKTRQNASVLIQSGPKLL
jgi:hypothetical protein